MATDDEFSRHALHQLSTFQLPPHFDLRSDTLSPLPSSLRSGLIAVTIFGFLSFFASLSLVGLLTWRMIKWSRISKAPNQFVILIYNLVLADIQQSVAFVLNTRWLAENSITVGTGGCWAQGWFVSTGDLGSGAFCFFIGLHTFASIVFNYRLSNLAFGLTVFGTWVFVYLLALIGVALHPSDIFVRAVSWCWMNSKYPDLRLWLHYFWIFTFEFGTVLIYICMYVAIQIRIKSNYYAENSTQAHHARTAAKLMIVYPIIYVICTLPLATLRMISMSSNSNLSFGWFCFAGAMITSNGWLDVLLYTMTRRILLFSDEPPPDSYGIETFSMPFSGPTFRRFGTKTTCEFSGDSPSRPSIGRWRSKSDVESQKSGLVSYASTTNLFDLPPPESRASFPSPRSRSDTFSIAVKTTTTYEVRSEPLVELEDMREAHTFKREESARTNSDKSEYDVDFSTKPKGWG